MALVGIKPQDRSAPNTEDHGIAIEFPDGASVQGMKIRILGLCPEQIVIAAWWLQRVADQTKDIAIMEKNNAQAVAEMDLAEIRRNPGGKPV